MARKPQFERGPWSVSFHYVDDDEGCPAQIRFPTEGGDLHAALASLFPLARMDLDALLNVPGPSGHGTLHHLIEGQGMAPFAQNRLEQLVGQHAPSWFEGSLLSLNCGDRERMFGFLNGKDRVYMPLWWDKEHSVCGHDPTYGASS